MFGASVAQIGRAYGHTEGPCQTVGRGYGPSAHRGSLPGPSGSSRRRPLYYTAVLCCRESVRCYIVFTRSSGHVIYTTPHRPSTLGWPGCMSGTYNNRAMTRRRHTTHMDHQHGAPRGLWQGTRVADGCTCQGPIWLHALYSRLLRPNRRALVC